MGPFAKQVREISIRLYATAAQLALTKGMIIADTKFEFGLDAAGTLTLMDEVLTPDSSRYWPVEGYVEGSNPPSFDKQIRARLARASRRSMAARGPSARPHRRFRRM
jgi:phosphoribosylaminoimidazole-succinocarboxamide synthase